MSSEATARASTILGCPGKATAVATNTTGLMAGADNMKVSAAAPTDPGPYNRRATGTDPHSQPGRAAPPIPATATAATDRFGSHLASRSGVTNVATRPLTITPSARNGTAWTKTPQNTVPAVASFSLASTIPRNQPAARAIAMSATTRISVEPNQRRSSEAATVTPPS
ncbi:Uncharacterised protein [Mycobacteroides abscessus subsp. abscessus]|nr:Uncharacterised protein [Mycobacteroides abscessus subsp. abscessus]